jgi:Tfp pilus assembly protein PilV
VKQHAFSLVEVTLALGVAAVSLLAIFALLPVGVKTTQTALEQTAATDMLSMVAADLRATPTTMPRGGATASPRFSIEIPANPVMASVTSTLFFTSVGQFSTTLEAKSRYRLTATFVPNGPGGRTATFVDLKMTWPAAAGLSNASAPVELFLALDRN